MEDILFVEMGAVVTEVLGPTRCTIEPWCDGKRPPTYSAGERFEVDFALLLDNVLKHRELLTSFGAGGLRAHFDQIPDHPSTPIGPSWPGGLYEGVVSIREDLVRRNPKLAAAVARLPGRPWEYQVVASVDKETGSVRRYHGFHAEVTGEEGDALVLDIVANAGRSAELSASRRTVRYDPRDTAMFYSGPLVAESAIRGGRMTRRSGAVFLAVDSLAAIGGSLPKLPAGLGD